MRHGKKHNHLGRKTAHRKAMLANMACSLIEHKRINTTVAKAKALRVFVEPLITKSKSDTTHNRRVVFSYLRDKYAVTELFREVSVKVADRPGGYVRIIKLGNRQGDNAPMAMVELVDYNELYNPKGNKAKKAEIKAKGRYDKITFNAQKGRSEKSNKTIRNQAQRKLQGVSDKLSDLLQSVEIKEEIHVDLAATKVPSHKVGLKIEDLCYQYPNARESLFNRLNFQLTGPERVALTGNNGAGKTALLEAIYFLLNSQDYFLDY